MNDTFSHDQLARVDDFVVRASMESKYSARRPSEAMKFAPDKPIPNAIALKIANALASMQSQPMSEWTAAAKASWEAVSNDLIEGYGYREEDGRCFCK